MMFKTSEEELEEAKQYLESIFDVALEVDMARAPQVYFLRRLREELREQKVLSSFHDAFLSRVDVSLSGLGGDYEPHKEWLDRMAVKMVKLAKALCDQLIAEGFSFDIIEAQFRSAKLGLTR